MLQSRAKYTVFVACQSYQRGIFAMVLKWNLHHPQVWYSKLVRLKQLQKALTPCFLSVSDYKRVYASLYFIITNFYTELNPQVKVSHGMHLHYTQYFINHGQLVNHTALIKFDCKLKSNGFLSSFVDLHWRIYLAYTSKASLTWKLIVLLSELGGGQLPPLPPLPGYAPGLGQHSLTRMLHYWTAFVTKKI